MFHFIIKKIKSYLFVDKQKDWLEYKQLNMFGTGGVLNSTNYSKMLPMLQGGWSNYLSGTLTEPSLLNLISILKNFHTSKYIYEVDDDFDSDYMENLLFTYGKVCVYRKATSNKFIFGNFSVNTTDENNYPISVNIHLKNFQNKKMVTKELRNLVPGKDCVLLYHDNSFLFIRNFFGPIWKIWHLLNILSNTINQINSNILINRSYITVPVGTSPSVKNNIDSALHSNQTTIELDDLGSSLGATLRTSKNVLEFRERSSELWENYYNLWDYIKTSMGIPTNANSNKKERQITDEVEKSNSLSDGILNREFIHREKAIDQINQVFSVSFSVKLLQKEIEKEQEKKQLMNSVNNQSTKK